MTTWDHLKFDRLNAFVAQDNTYLPVMAYPFQIESRSQKLCAKLATT